jgi:predicted Rossmann fold nucleotide-binding protein DprA/Smf involved in DNA uptake
MLAVRAHRTLRVAGTQTIIGTTGKVRNICRADAARSWRLERLRKDLAMDQRANTATLNVQPRQRRQVYAELAKAPDGRSVKELLQDSDMPEQELRETLRKLDSAGLAQRVKGTWRAVPLSGADGESAGSD